MEPFSSEKFIPPGTERLELFLPLIIKPLSTSAMERIWQKFHKAAGSYYPRQRGESLLRVASESSPIVRALLEEFDSSRSARPQPSVTTTEHRILSEYAESYSRNSYHRKLLQDQLVLRMSLSPSGLKIVADAPPSLWLQLYLRGMILPILH